MCPFPAIQVSMATSVSPGHNWHWHPSYQPIRRSTSTHDPSLVAINGQANQRWWTGKSQQIRILPFRTTLLNYDGKINSQLARTVDPRDKLHVICYYRNLHIKVLEVYSPLSMGLRKPEALLFCHFKVTWKLLPLIYMTIDCSSFFITCSCLSSYLSELSLSIQILEADCSRLGDWYHMSCFTRPLNQILVTSRELYTVQFYIQLLVTSLEVHHSNIRKYCKHGIHVWKTLVHKITF